MSFWSSEKPEASGKKSEKPQATERKTDRPITPDLVGLNHRLLEEISQVQLKMVDILQENVRLKSEIDQLKKLVLQIESHMQEVGRVEVVSSEDSESPGSLASRRSSSGKKSSILGEKPRSDPGSRPSKAPPVPQIVGKFDKLSDLGRSMKEMEALVLRIAEAHEPDGVLPTNPSRLMKFLPVPPVVPADKPMPFVQEMMAPTIQEKVPQPFIQSPFLSRLSLYPQENILESSPSLIDRLRSHSFLSTPRIGGFAIPVMAVLPSQEGPAPVASEIQAPIKITDQRVALSSASKALLEQFSPSSPSDSPPSQEEEERPAPLVKPMMKANPMFRRSRVSEFSVEPAEPTANGTDLSNIAEADGGKGTLN